MAALWVERLDLERRRAFITASVTPVDGKGLVWGVPKTYEPRRVPIPAFLIDALQAQVRGLDPKELVFRIRAPASTDRDPHGPVRMGARPEAEQSRQREADKDLPSARTAAHGRILGESASGADVKVVQLMLGHKDASVTLNQYGHLFADHLDIVTDAMTAARQRALADAEDSSNSDGG